jgi:hypothetical protein
MAVKPVETPKKAHALPSQKRGREKEDRRGHVKERERKRKGGGRRQDTVHISEREEQNMQSGGEQRRGQALSARGEDLRV